LYAKAGNHGQGMRQAYHSRKKTGRCAEVQTGSGRPCEWRVRHVLMPGAPGAGTSMLACRLTAIFLSMTLPARRPHLSVDI
jgi:hypothetical protein